MHELHDQPTAQLDGVHVALAGPREGGEEEAHGQGIANSVVLTVCCPHVIPATYTIASPLHLYQSIPVVLVTTSSMSDQFQTPIPSVWSLGPVSVSVSQPVVPPEIQA